MPIVKGEHRETSCYRLRTQAGLSMAQLAVHAGVTEKTVRNLERVASLEEAYHLKVGVLLKVAEALGVQPWQLYPRLGGR